MFSNVHLPIFDDVWSWARTIGNLVYRAAVHCWLDLCFPSGNEDRLFTQSRYPDDPKEHIKPTSGRKHREYVAPAPFHRDMVNAQYFTVVGQHWWFTVLVFADASPSDPKEKDTFRLPSCGVSLWKGPDPQDYFTQNEHRFISLQAWLQYSESLLVSVQYK